MKMTGKKGWLVSVGKWKPRVKAPQTVYIYPKFVVWQLIGVWIHCQWWNKIMNLYGFQIDVVKENPKKKKNEPQFICVKGRQEKKKRKISKTRQE